MKFLVAQLGARGHYAIPRMMHEAGLLERFFTDICAVKGWPRILNLIRANKLPHGLRRLAGRIPDGVPREKIWAFTSLGLTYARARARATSADQAAAVYIAFGQKLCKDVLRIGFGQATVTYTFNSAGLELMKAAREAGLKTVMEQTIAPYAVEAEILSDAVDRYPDWAEAIPAGPNIDAFVAREEEEWKHADMIICGSEFVRDGIARRGGPVERCQVVPYGVDNRFFFKREPHEPRPLRVLSVGQVGLRKGTPDVWAAAVLVGKKVEFRMVGEVVCPQNALVRKPNNVELVGSVPRTEIIKHYRWADVFLLPSLCEGSATVTYEAIMSGLPVICTPNTGTIIQDGKEGFIVPILAPDIVAGCLLSLSQSPALLTKLSAAALDLAGSAGIAAYRQRLLTTLKLLNL